MEIYAAPGMAVMFAGVAVNIAVSQFLIKMARKHRSPALEADGIHLRADVWTSGAVLVGLGCIHFGAPAWVDSLLAMLVAAMVAYEGTRLMHDAVKDLVDTALPPDERDIIEHTLAEYNGPYVGFHKLRARRMGRKRQADVHVVVCQQLTVGEAHDITEKLKTSVAAALPGTDLVVHVEPCEDEDCLETAEPRGTPAVQAADRAARKRRPSGGKVGRAGAGDASRRRCAQHDIVRRKGRVKEGHSTSPPGGPADRRCGLKSAATQADRRKAKC